MKSETNQYVLKPIFQPLEEYLVAENVIKANTVKYLGRGEGHINYTAETDQGIVVVRVKRDDTPSNPGFANERTQLLFVEAQGIDFAPRSLFYDPQREVHVITFVEGRDTSTLELDEAQQNALVSQLIAIESLKYKDYVQFCLANSLEILPIDPMTERIERNFDKRLIAIKQVMPALPEDISPYISWCEDKFKGFATLAEQLPTAERYLHGDLRWNNGTSNLMIGKDGNVIFIDWEKARFAEDSLLELGDIIASLPHISEHKPLIRGLVDSYLEQTKLDLSEEKIKARLKLSLWFAAIGTPLWALERYALMTEAGLGAPDQYLEKAKERIDQGDLYLNFDF